MISTHSSFANVYSDNAKKNPEKVAFRYLDESISKDKILTYDQLLVNAKKIAIQISQVTKPSDKAVVVIPTSIEFMPSIVGCWLAGITPVPIYPPKENSLDAGLLLINAICKSSEATCIITFESISSAWQKSQKFSSLTKLPTINIDTTLSDKIDIEKFDENKFTELALLLYTSGSTGAPKGVMITHAMLLHNYTEFIKIFHLDLRNKICVWLPNCHIAGFYLRTINALVGGETIVFPAVKFLENPSYWLEIISKYKINMSAAPNFAYEICSGIETIPEKLDLSSWTMAITGGEVVKKSVYEKFVEKYSSTGFKETSFLPYYGMTETLCTTIRHPNKKLSAINLNRKELEQNKAIEVRKESKNSVTFLSSGYALGSNDVKIVNPENSEICQENQVGEIWVHGKNVTAGYWQQPDINAKTTNALFKPDGKVPYFKTGDFGFFKNAELFITGRLKELIIIHGKNYYPQDIENTVSLTSKNFNIQACAAFSYYSQSNEVLGIAIEAPNIGDQSAELENKINIAMSKTHGISASIVILKDQLLPRTSNGKIKRSECSKIFTSGKWNGNDYKSNISQIKLTREVFKNFNSSDKLDSESIFKILKFEIAELIQKPTEELISESKINELGIDSIQAVQLISKLKREYKLNLNVSILYRDINLAAVAEDLVCQSDSKSTLSHQKIDFQNDILEIEDIIPKQLPNKSNTPAKNIFLTGATGFLGSYLLKDLLQLTDAKIYCLVRAKNKENGKKRIEDSLRKISDLNENHLARIEPIPGHLDQPNFGIDDENFNFLSENIDQIFHNGANVNFVAPYESLYSVNVYGNFSILKLAVNSKLKNVHFISTVAVFNGPERDQFDPIKESDALPTPNNIFSGYAQTKWVSETLYKKAQQLGLPVSIYRPALVMGDSESGYCHTEDFLCRFIKGCLQLGSFPNIPIQIDMSPVNFVAQSIVKISQEQSSINQAYHIRNPRSILLPNLAAWFQKYGYKVTVEDSEQWHEKIATTLTEDNALYPVYPFLLQKIPNTNETILNFFGKRKINLDDSNLQKYIDIKKGCPPVDNKLLKTYTEYFINEKFLEMLNSL